MLPNIDRIKNVEYPVYIIHSIKDEVIPFYYAKEMYSKVKNKFYPLYIDGTSHKICGSIEVFALHKFLQYLTH